jgi:hypothetical protein
VSGLKSNTVQQRGEGVLKLHQPPQRDAEYQRAEAQNSQMRDGEYQSQPVLSGVKSDTVQQRGEGVLKLHQPAQQEAEQQGVEAQNSRLRDREYQAKQHILQR